MQFHFMKIGFETLKVCFIMILKITKVILTILESISNMPLVYIEEQHAPSVGIIILFGKNVF